MSAEHLQGYVNRIDAELRENILPFWMKYAINPAGGFVGELDAENCVVPGKERGSLLTSRILWTFASAYRVKGVTAYREMADWAYRDLLETFWDGPHGGLIWSVDAEGKPARTRKQVYGLAFGIYALSEYFRATGTAEALQRAKELFDLIETHAVDLVHGGYWEACSREWQPLEDMRLSEVDMNEPKSQNTHLHVMEAYTNLLRVWPDERLRKAQARLLDVMLERILDEKSHHLGLFFNAEWQSKTERISYGHDIEAAWLLTEAAEVLGEPQRLKRIRQVAVGIAQVTLAEAIDTDGAILYEGTPEKGVTVTIKEWWPQAEAAVGFLNAYQISGDKVYLETALRLWDFIEKHLVDRKGGEWFRYVTKAGMAEPGQAKISFWKCPYHNGRTCLELGERLRKLQISDLG